MPLQNRVLPTGEIVAHPARGLFTGNRGILHKPDMTLGTARWRHQHWVICTLAHPRGTYHGPMPDRGWSALFFLDEAVALAAGHRPCHYCRRDAYRAYCGAWTSASGERHDRIKMDRTLHAARVTRRREQIRFTANADDLPDGTFVMFDNTPHLVWGNHLYPYEPTGYLLPTHRPRQPLTVLTPQPTVRVLDAGYRPLIHPSTGLSA